MTSHTEIFHCFLCFTAHLTFDIWSESVSVVLLWIWSRNHSINLGHSIAVPVNLKSSWSSTRCCSWARSRAIPESVSELLRFTAKTISWPSTSLSINAFAGSPTGSTWAGRCRGFDLTWLNWGVDVPPGLGVHNGVLLEHGWFKPGLHDNFFGTVPVWIWPRCLKLLAWHPPFLSCKWKNSWHECLKTYGGQDYLSSWSQCWTNRRQSFTY